MESLNLKIIPDCLVGNRTFSEDELDNNSWWYLHGELERKFGYDKGIAVNCKTVGLSVPTIDWSSIDGKEVKRVFSEKDRWELHANGEIPVEVEGVDEPCIGYFWTTDLTLVSWKGNKYPLWKQRGLVCLLSDKKGCEDALKKYKASKSRI